MSVHRLSLLGLINVYLIETSAGPVLVDGAAPGMMPWLRRGLRRHGLVAADLAGVVVTHFHRDHVGTASALAAEGVPLYAHRDEIPILTGQAPHPGYGPGRAGRTLHWLEQRALGPIRFDEVRALDTDEPLLGSHWRVLAAPGHTPGSLALLNGHTGEMLSGDTLVNQLGRARGPHPTYTADLSTALRSAIDLLDRKPTRILPGHGPPVGPEAYDRARASWSGALADSAP